MNWTKNKTELDRTWRNWTESNRIVLNLFELKPTVNLNWTSLILSWLNLSYLCQTLVSHLNFDWMLFKRSVELKLDITDWKALCVAFERHQDWQLTKKTEWLFVARWIHCKDIEDGHEVDKSKTLESDMRTFFDEEIQRQETWLEKHRKASDQRARSRYESLADDIATERWQCEHGHFVHRHNRTMSKPMKCTEM